MVMICTDLFLYALGKGQEETNVEILAREPFVSHDGFTFIAAGLLTF